MFTDKLDFYPRTQSDFEGLLSRDDLDETAQAIIAQLQDLIAKQGIVLRNFKTTFLLKATFLK